MRILTALTYYYPHWTGLTAFAQRIAEGLAARGHEITVVTSRYNRDLPAEETYNGVHIRRVNGWFRLSRGQVMPGFLPEIQRQLPHHDAVQVHTPMLETWPVTAAAHRAGLGVLMTHHGDLVMPAGLGDRIVQHAVGYMLERGAQAADIISIYTLDYTLNSDFLRPHIDKVVPVYPPVVIPEPDPEVVAAWRRELGLDGVPIVGFAGRFVEEKGFDYLLEAMPMVREQVPGTVFLFAGETNVVYESFYQRCMPALEANRDHIVSLGLITDTQRLANYYAMCDLFTLPSRTDCFASVQVEAMLCGTPVVATNIPGAREVVKVTGMGKLVEPRNPRSLADGIIEVLTNRKRYLRSRAEIAAIFDYERAISDYERLLGALARPAADA
ncbi:MAG: glycosyltransferase family 4 protein [Chloroflexi bacterium]|nr:glycosyltransferase family 4 protein [Chloroflexota bacterium]